jgi:putative tryptophan/tyrosine transport system substrate-binding protein
VTVRKGQPTFVLSLLLGFPLLGVSESRPASPSVVVVASSGVEAHRSAIEGIQAALGKSSSQIRIVDLAEARRGLAAGVRLATPGIRLIIAVGTEALQIVEGEQPTVPVICTMILRSTPEPYPAASPAATISLEVSIASLLVRLRLLFPEKTRLGIIRNPALGGLNSAPLPNRSHFQGFTVRSVECTGADQLLAAFDSLKGQVDFVWCLPDGTLYNSATIKPLILASIEHRLPLIGFSENFTRAGAAVGIYPDFRDIGLQTGEVARQVLDGQPLHTPEGPRRLKVAVNQSVLRLLGLRYAPAAADSGEFSILR